MFASEIVLFYFCIISKAALCNVSLKTTSKITVSFSFDVWPTLCINSVRHSRGQPWFSCLGGIWIFGYGYGFPRVSSLLLSCSTLIFLIGFLGPTAEGQIDIQQATVIRQQQLRSLINSWSLCPSEISVMWLNVINSNISSAWLPSPAAIMVTEGQA